MADAKIFDALKRDHDNHRALIKQMDAKAEDKAALAKLFETFHAEVSAHAAAEEESLYATMLAKPDLREDAQHSVSEHKEIEDFLKELAAMDITAEVWAKKYKKMKERYLHHIEEEEEEMFPDASEALTATEEKKLAEVFAKRKPEELKKAEEEA